MLDIFNIKLQTGKQYGFRQRSEKIEEQTAWRRLTSGDASATRECGIVDQGDANSLFDFRHFDSTITDKETYLWYN